MIMYIFDGNRMVGQRDVQNVRFRVVGNDLINDDSIYITTVNGPYEGPFVCKFFTETGKELDMSGPCAVNKGSKSPLQRDQELVFRPGSIKLSFLNK